MELRGQELSGEHGEGKNPGVVALLEGIGFRNICFASRACSHQAFAIYRWKIWEKKSPGIPIELSVARGLNMRLLGINS